MKDYAQLHVLSYRDLVLKGYRMVITMISSARKFARFARKISTSAQLLVLTNFLQCSHARILAKICSFSQNAANPATLANVGDVTKYY